MAAINAGFSRLDRLKIRSRVNLYLEMQSRPSELGLGQSQDPRLWIFYLAMLGIGKPENDGYNPLIQKLCSHMTLGRWVGLLCQADRRQETTALTSQKIGITARIAASQIRLIRSLSRSRPVFPGPDWTVKFSTPIPPLSLPDISTALWQGSILSPSKQSETKQNNLDYPLLEPILRLRSRNPATRSLMLLAYPPESSPTPNRDKARCLTVRSDQRNRRSSY